MTAKTKTNLQKPIRKTPNRSATSQINLQNSGFLRLYQIIGHRKRGIQGLIPIGRTTFLEGVKKGIYPKPVKLGERCVAWKAEDIRA
ncbi:MAG: helix-turn-helix transcriptional regulator, partial [Methylosarcina sp.]